MASPETPEVSSSPSPSTPTEMLPELTPVPRQPRKRFIGKRAATELQQRKSTGDDANTSPEGAGSSSTVKLSTKPLRTTGRAINQIPPSILHNDSLNTAITTLLPHNYNFEIHKTIHHIQKHASKRIALQMPEGLLLFATTISDIIETFCPGVETLIMGDVTYGACCIDDFTARALECDLLVHYAHSCLIPIDVTEIKTLYIFVTIGIDTSHLIATIQRNFSPPSEHHLALVGTIQFNSTLHTTKATLSDLGYKITIPQIAPLSKGEILGCTSPRLPNNKNNSNDPGEEIDALLYIGDGRFHLESAMIQNPHLKAFRYDPYTQKLTLETYNHTELHTLRRSAIDSAKRAKKFGLILGTLGRQGNPHTLDSLEARLKMLGIEYIVLLLSEIFPGKLALFGDVDAWVQVACPRLSIDWGYAFEKPLLSPYEAGFALGVREERWDGEKGYEMGFYGKGGLGRLKRGQGL